MSEESFARRNVKRRLLEIQEQAKELQRTATEALRDIANLDAIRIVCWRCVHCGYVTRFPKPQTIEACAKCSKCQSSRWVPDGVEDEDGRE